MTTWGMWWVICMVNSGTFCTCWRCAGTLGGLKIVGTVDGWNPAPPGMYKTLIINNGINYQPQLLQDFSHQQYHESFFHDSRCSQKVQKVQHKENPDQEEQSHTFCWISTAGKKRHIFNWTDFCKGNKKPSKTTCFIIFAAKWHIVFHVSWKKFWWGTLATESVSFQWRFCDLAPGKVNFAFFFFWGFSSSFRRRFAVLESFGFWIPDLYFFFLWSTISKAKESMDYEVFVNIFVKKMWHFSYSEGWRDLLKRCWLIFCGMVIESYINDKK